MIKIPKKHFSIKNAKNLTNNKKNTSFKFRINQTLMRAPFNLN